MECGDWDTLFFAWTLGVLLIVILSRGCGVWFLLRSMLADIGVVERSGGQCYEHSDTKEQIFVWYGIYRKMVHIPDIPLAQ